MGERERPGEEGAGGEKWRNQKNNQLLDYELWNTKANLGGERQQRCRCNGINRETGMMAKKSVGHARWRNVRPQPKRSVQWRASYGSGWWDMGVVLFVPWLEYKEYKEPGPGTSRPSFLGFRLWGLSGFRVNSRVLVKNIKNMRRGIFGMRPHPKGRCNGGAGAKEDWGTDMLFPSRVPPPWLAGSNWLGLKYIF